LTPAADKHLRDRKAYLVPDLWFGLEVRHLVALPAIADEGSFAGAAQRLGYTQVRD